MIIKDIELLEEMSLGKSKDLSLENFEHCKAIKRIKPIKENKSRAALWLCRCECGEYFTTEGIRLVNGTCQTCGCLQKKIAGENLSKHMLSISGKPKNDHRGEIYGKLKIIEFKGIDENRHSLWSCECECENLITLPLFTLTKGDTKSCGCLKQSFGSYKIEQILIENNIPYEKEKTFETCRFPNTNSLARFDFYVDGTLVEFDGKQHYEFVGGYFKLEDFYALQKRDAYKNEWCIKNNIKLIRISYKDENKLSLEYLKGRIQNER